VTRIVAPPRILWEDLIASDLRIDLGRAGDLTTEAVVDATASTTASVVARQEGRMAGLEIACSAFTMLDPRIHVTREVADGDDVEAGASVATLGGPARAILTAERTALNLLGHLSGIATATRDVVRLVEGTGARIAETRKSLVAGSCRAS